MSDLPRKVALDLLRAVRDDDAYANLALPTLLTRYRLDGRDAAFATELSFGTLRWQGWYDCILAACINRPWQKVEPDLRDILRLGAHQVLALRVPAHAAVDSSCVLAKELIPTTGAKARVGFVNAVLRQVTAHDEQAWAQRLRGTRGGDDIEWLASRWSHPGWIVRAFKDALGERRSELVDLLAADNLPPRPVLVARPGRITPTELVASDDVGPGRWSPLAATLQRGAPVSVQAVRDGRAGVQDEGSQLAALALARVDIDGPDRAWLDLCAGPGGKAALLEGLVVERGGRLVAVEQHDHRADLVRRALAPHTSSTVLVGDARDAPWADAKFDRVLVDAPCTGLGALRRRPEARWRRTPADLAVLGRMQRELLETAIEAARPGGVIAYVTCSPHLAETEFVVSDVVRRRGDVRQVDAREWIPELPDCGGGPAVQMWPHRHGTDAMFVALLRK